MIGLCPYTNGLMWIDWTNWVGSRAEKRVSFWGKLLKMYQLVPGVRTNLENASEQFSFSNRDEIIVFDNKISFASVKTLCIHSIASCVHCCHFSSNTYCKLHPSIFEFWYEVPALSNLRTILKRNIWIESQKTKISELDSWSLAVEFKSQAADWKWLNSKLKEILDKNSLEWVWKLI